MLVWFAKPRAHQTPKSLGKERMERKLSSNAKRIMDVKVHHSASEAVSVLKSLISFSEKSEVHGEVLDLIRISRTEMGAYLCIARNGVSPAVSKRIILNVDCKYIKILGLIGYAHSSPFTHFWGANFLFAHEKCNNPKKSGSLHFFCFKINESTQCLKFWILFYVKSREYQKGDFLCNFQTLCHYQPAESFFLGNANMML